MKTSTWMFATVAAFLILAAKDAWNGDVNAAITGAGACMGWAIAGVMQLDEERRRLLG